MGEKQWHTCSDSDMKHDLQGWWSKREVWSEAGFDGLVDGDVIPFSLLTNC